jgi:MFS family permease
MPSSSVDRLTSLGVAFGFSVSLGVATVAIPLLALDSGYDAAAVGFLAATSAASQLGTRLLVPWLLGRFPDRTLIAGAAGLMTIGFVLLLWSTALPVFVAAQLLQGASRAIFWIGSQTHAIRGGGQPIQRLVDLNVSGNAGTLVGPALAGSLATIGLPVAIAAAAIGAALAIVGTPLLVRFPPYDRARSAGAVGLLRRPGVAAACWASVVGGTWWSMVGSYIPVILVDAGLGPQPIGLLVTASEGAGTVALLTLRRIHARWIAAAVRTAAYTAMAALTAIALAPAVPTIYAALLVIGGAAGGAVTTLSPALISLVSDEHEQGDALSLSGVFRAASLLGSPAAVGALLGLTSVGGAIVIATSTIVASGLAIGVRGGRSGGTGVP